MGTELHVFTKADIEWVLKFSAQMQIVGRIFCGHIGPQELRWLEDGSVEVRTEVKREPLPAAAITNPPKPKRKYHKQH